MRISWRNTRASARLYSAVTRPQAAGSGHSITEGETTYFFDRSKRSLYLEDHAVFRRHMTVSMLRTLANLHEKQLIRKSVALEEGAPSVGPFSKINTHITGLTMNNILNISNTPGNEIALMRYAVEVPGLKEIAILLMQNVNDHAFRKNMERQSDIKAKFHFLQDTDDRRAVQDVLAGQKQNVYDAVVIDTTKFPTKALCNSAIKCVKDGGLISLSFPFFKYYAKGKLIDAQYNSELTLRASLHTLYSSVLTSGAKMLPLACYSYRGVVQLFVRVFYSEENFTCQFPGQTGVLHHCPQCTNFLVDFEKLQQQRCKQCGSAMQASDSLWMSPYADRQMVYALYKDVKKHHRKHLTGESMMYLLSHLEQEVPDGLFFHHPQNYNVKFGLQKPLPTNLLMSALENMGYATSLSHLRKNCVKTLAPPEAVWDVVRKWAEIFPGKDISISPLHSKIINKGPENNVNFLVNLEVNKKLCRLRDRSRSWVGKKFSLGKIR